MIPHRIRMAGFLSYKGEQEVEFSTAALWMLAGTNGSGKSSVFDAVTYALFGTHRGGTQNAGELINKESNQLCVEFDFRLGGELYRAKRTLKKDAKGKSSGTQQLFKHTEPNKWDAVPDTNLKTGFERWIRENIGLNYETFTSSVLLLQGKAEKLLDSAPKGRAEVLAQIVDLERYQKLHERANQKRLALKSKLEAVTHLQEAIPEVTDLEFAGALLTVEARTDDQTEARAAVADAQNLEREAERYADATMRQATASARLAAAEALLGDAGTIEQQAARLNDLQAALPAVGVVLQLRADREASDQKTAATQKHREEAGTRKKAAEHRAGQAAKKREAAAQQLTEAELELREVLEQLPGVLLLLEKVSQLEQTNAKLADLKAEREQVGDAGPAARTAQTEVDRLTDIHAALPHLVQFNRDRHGLRDARQQADAAEKQLKQLKQAGQTLRAEVDQAKTKLAEAQEIQAKAQAQRAEASLLLKQAKAAKVELTRAGGGADCKVCGQPLTAAHRAAETERRTHAVTAANQAHAAAQTAATEAAQQVQHAQAHAEQLNEQLTKLRESYKEVESNVAQENQTAKRLHKALDLRFAEMPPLFQVQITQPVSGDWADTTFPERDELARFTREAERLTDARRQAKAANDALARAARLATQIDTLAETVATLTAGLNGLAPAALTQQKIELTSRKSVADDALTAARAAREKFDRDLIAARQEVHEAEQSLTSLQGRLDTEAQRRKGLIAQEQQALTGMSDDWQQKLKSAGFGDHARWQSDHDQLVRDGIPERSRKLLEARAGLAGLAEDVTMLRAAAEAFPPEVRVPVEVARLTLQQARDRLAATEGELAAARQVLANFEKHRAERAQFGAELLNLTGEYKRLETLSDLLGRNRLQRYLVRQAERQIVEFGNGVLDRLSGGQLYLRLVGADDGADTERALDLECANRFTGGSPINVTFLSGSQKFRVAVSLALAIGQYASKQHRPIESVIIDEGFGCLDRQGRQVMIQEFQNLREHLRCILLVSHQDEFADAFPDGYRFELKDGATAVARFQR